jgi:nuclear pore complex protein Nup98-Nup96
MSSCSAILLVLTQQRRREKAIKDLLTRQAMKLDDWTMRGFCGSLKIPTSWVNEAKVRFDPMLHGLQCPYKLTMDSQAIYALDKGEVYQAYESYLTAQLYNPAHELAVLELAPDAIIRKDLDLLKDIFERFNSRRVDNWNIRGKVWLALSITCRSVVNSMGYNRLSLITPTS